MLYTKEFWRDTFERTLYTVLETFLGIVSGMSLITQINWEIVASSCAMAGIVTIAKCVLVAVNKENKR